MLIFAVARLAFELVEILVMQIFMLTQRKMTHGIKIGDLSIVIIVVALFIYFKPNCWMLDPIFTIIVSTTTIPVTFPIFKDAIKIIMEGTPKHIDIQALEEDLWTLSAEDDI